MGRAVAYYRVSTDKQGRSGLGLEAQQREVEEYCVKAGLHLIAPPFQEVESGRRNDRPELLKAIARCKVTGATLVVAKLDRLTRNVAFLGTLRDSRVKFVAADMPNANNLTVNILVSVAEFERECASKRTKEALAAAKARGTWRKRDGTPYKSGTRFGNPNGAAALARAGRGFAQGTAKARRIASAYAEDLRPMVEYLREAGFTSMGAIARELNAQSIRTPRADRNDDDSGRWTWHASSVRNLLARLRLSE